MFDNRSSIEQRSVRNSCDIESRDHGSAKMSKVEEPRTNDASDALPSLLHISEVLCQSELEVSPDSSQEPSWIQFKDMAQMLQPLADGIWHWQPDGFPAESAESAEPADEEHEIHEIHEAASAASAASAQCSQEIDSKRKEIDDAATKAACTSPVRAVKPRTSCVPTHQRLDSLASTYLPESEAKFDGDDVKPQPASNPSDDAEHVKEDGRDNGWLQYWQPVWLSGCNSCSSCSACAELVKLAEPVSLFATATWPTWPIWPTCLTWPVCCQTVTPVTEAEAGADGA
eukprot:s3131_g3.t1